MISEATEAGQICAFLTFDILANTLKGVTSPTTVTFFAAKSMLNEVTPAHIIHYINMCPEVVLKRKAP